MSVLLRCAISLALIFSDTLAAQAGNYPSQQVDLIVAYPAGGAADLIARSMAQRLSQLWNVAVVVENRGGGATQVAANAVAQSPGDGYKLLVTGMETFAINPSLYPTLTYDPVNGFVPVSSFGYSNQMLMVPAASPFKDVGDVLAQARKENAGLQYGTIGPGGSSHINMVLLENLAGVHLTPIHYHGGAPLLNDLLGNHVPMGFLSTGLVDQDIKSGLLRAVGVSSKARVPEFPDVPTIAESGVPGYEAVSWFGLWAPKGTPADVVQKINADVQNVFADPAYKKQFLTPYFINVRPGNPQDFATYIKSEADKWSKVIKEAHLQINN
jgi:tripartite-type tricarboxylate transporter receptor subunit TctC